MCGISCAVSKNASVDLAYITKMNNLIAHRGPDHSEVISDGIVCLGHRRLSIIDTSSLGNQPMWYGSDYVIVYNGEVYNYLEIRDVLKAAGYSFHTLTDTEVILAAYDYWGHNCVEQFNGMWSFVIYDKKKQELFCSRDRFGVKPFYYMDREDSFLIGSEIKQLIHDFEPTANHEKVFEFLLLGVSDTDENTFFQGVKKLPAGHNLIFALEHKTFYVNKWYDLTLVKSKMESGSAKATIKSLFEDSIKLRLRSDVPVGSCLSGGIDSSGIVAIGSRLLKSRNSENVLSTITAAFEEEHLNEYKYAQSLCSEKGCSNHLVRPSYEGFANELRDVMWHQEEPFGSFGIYAQWEVFKKAKALGLTVMLDGQGADEAFGGYSSFYVPYINQMFFRGEFHELYKTIHGSSRSLLSARTAVYSVLSRFLPFALFKSGYRRRKQRTIDLIKFEDRNTGECILRKYYDGLRSFRECSLGQILSTSLPMLLRFEDKNSMAFSIEARLPYLDYRLVEYSLKIDVAEKISNGYTKNVLREALNQDVPSGILKRKDKLGFSTPSDTWISENCHKIIDRIFNNQKMKEIVNLEHLSKLSVEEVDRDLVFRMFILSEWIETFSVKW